MAAQLAGSPYPALVRLPDDRTQAEEECRAITARVETWLDGRGMSREDAIRALRALRELLRTTPGTLARAIADYKQSHTYLRVEPRTRKQYDWALDEIEEADGHRPVSELSPEWLRTAVGKWAEGARSQQVFLTLLAIVIDHNAHTRRKPGDVVANPARLALSELGKPETKGSWIWPELALDTLIKAADALGWPSIGTAVLLNAWLGQEMKQILKLPRSVYLDGVLRITRHKSRQFALIPVDVGARLKERLEWQFAEEARRSVRRLAHGPLIVRETTGKPWMLDGFRHEFARVRSAVSGAPNPPGDGDKLAAAGVAPIGGFTLDAVHIAKSFTGLPIVRTTELKFGDLRHTGVVRLHHAGCSDNQIRDISGQPSPARIYDQYPATITQNVSRPFPSPDVVQEICKRGEDQLHEFKGQGTEMEKISREIAAMLNTSQGGFVFYGVDDSGAIQGADKSRQTFDQALQNSIHNTIRPAARVDLAEVTVMGSPILVVSVPPRGRNEVYYFKGKVFIRKGTNVIEATPDEIRKLHAGDYIV